jgi:uncharacterized delta-60 repeat protein
MLFASALRLALRWSGLALIAVISPQLWAQSSSAAADGFDPNVNGNVYAMLIQPDGKILVAGSFPTVSPNGGPAISRSNIARFLPSGNVDTSFDPDAINGQINAIALQADGKIIIGGKFTAVGGATRNHGARLNSNGKLDSGFDPNLTGSLTPEVMAVAVQADGKVLFGGGFTSAAGKGINRVARFTAAGVLDESFNPNANGMVLAFAVQPDGKIVIGGGFTTLGTTARKRVARLNSDGTPDTFDPSADNAVSVIELMPDGRILIGGSFTKLTPNGGTETAVLHISRLNSDGTLSTGFTGGTDGPVSAIKLQRDGSILVGGAFSSLGNGSRPYIGRLYPSGVLDYSFFAGPNFNVYAIGIQSDNSVVLAGGFTTLNGTGRTTVVRNHVARISPAGGLDASFRPDANGRLQSVGLQADKKILIGGSFTSIAGQTRRGFARLNASGSLDTGFKPDLDGPVIAFAEQTDGKIVVGGSFTRVGGLTRQNLARLNSDGSVDPTFDPAPNAQVNAVTIQADGKILIGGAFTVLRPNATTEPVVRSYVARINADGTLDTSFNPAADGAVAAIVIQPSDKKILLGGSFTSFAPNGATAATRRLALARLNTDGTLDTGFDPTVDGAISAILVQGDGKVVFGGAFIRMAPNNSPTITARNNIGRVNGDGTLDSGFDPNVNGTVFALALQSDGKIVLGGRFTSVGNTDRNFAARLESSGAVDASFDLKLDALPGNQVAAFAQPSDGQLLVGGAFTSILGRSRNRLALISSGALDESFNSDVSTATGPAVAAVVTQLDGGIIAAGSFAGLNGTGSSNLAHFTADSAPDANFSPSIDGPVYAMGQLPTRGASRNTQRAGFAWLQGNGDLRSGFSFPADLSLGAVIDVAIQPDGKILTAGTTPATGTNGSLVRFNADGTVDTSFKPASDGSVNAVIVQPDNKILIAGEFTTVGGTTHSNVARLNADGTVDAGFSPNTNAMVLAMLLQPDGKILIGGNFTSIQANGAATSTARNFVARLNGDGSLDTTFNPNPNSSVVALAVQSDKVWIGGNFTAVQPNGATTSTARTFVARLNSDGTLDSAIDLKANSAVNALAVQSDGKDVIGGYFTSIGSETRNYLARVGTDGVLDAAFNPNANGAVLTVSVQSDGKILAGGTFNALEPGNNVYNAATATPRNRAVRLNADGTIDPTFNPNFDNAVSTLFATSDNTIIATGSFSTIQPTGSLLVGGSFGYINGLVTKNLVLFSSDGSISSTFQPNPNGAVYAIVPQLDGRVVVGGAFTTMNGATRKSLARFNSDDALDTGFNPDADNTVYAVVRQPDGKLLVGGAFRNIGGASRNYVARLNADGSNDGSFSAALPGPVHAIALQADGRILVTTGDANAALVRLNSDGSTDSGFNANNDAAVSSMAIQADGHIIVGGSFTTIGGAAHKYLARLNSNGSLDATLTAAPNGPVTALALQSDGKIVIGGMFSAVDSLPRFGLARIAAPAPATDVFTTNASYTSATWTLGGGAPIVDAVYFEKSTDAINWTTIGEGARAAGTNSYSIGTNLLASSPTYIRVRGVISVTPNGSSGLIGAQTQYNFAAAAPSVPVITSATAVSGASGSSFLYSISALGTPTSYGATGLPDGLSINSVTGVISGTPTVQGTFNVVLSATNSLGTGTTTLTLIIGAPGSVTNEGRVINLSVLAQVSSGNPIIAGFVIKGSSPQKILLRAVGPGLANMLSGVLSAPNLKVFNSSGVVVSESNSWGGNATLVSEMARLGAFPLGTTSTDAAVLLTLNPGPYTLHVSDPGTTGGAALAEVYDANVAPPPANSPHLVNISARGIVAADHIVTGGFVITGTTARRILIRGIGPGLAPQGVASPIGDPAVTLNHIGVGVIATNDNWQTPTTSVPSYPGVSGAEIAAAATATGAFALADGSKDAAILVTLAPGIYTAQVNGVAGATGPAMVEVYEVP